MTDRPPIAIAIFCAIMAATFFSLNDLGIKFLSGDYPLHQIVLTRALVGLLLTVVLFAQLEGGISVLRTQKLGLHLLRGALVVAANMLFFLGLATLPLAEATAIFFVSPLVITLFSVIFLGEKVGPFRWFAVGLGLLGAIVMLRPTPESFRAAALLPFISAFCYAGLHILTRKMGGTERASTMAFYIQLTFVLVSAAMGLTVSDGRFAVEGNETLSFLLRAWIWPSLPDFLIMCCVGVASGVGGYCISQAYRLSEAAIIAPFEYLALVLSVIWGVIIFTEFPDLIGWIGIALIIGGGFMMIWREAINNSTKRRFPRNRP